MYSMYDLELGRIHKGNQSGFLLSFTWIDMDFLVVTLLPVISSLDKMIRTFDTLELMGCSLYRRTLHSLTWGGL